MELKMKVKIAATQMSCDWKIENNLNKAIKLVETAAQKGANIICLPELFSSYYFCQTEKHSNFNLAEKIPGPTTKLFSSLAKQLKIILMISLFEKKTAGIYHNTSVLINEKGKIIGKYRKMHIPDDPQY